MNPSTDRVLRYLAGNENIENISIDELQNLADEHPYFAVAQFLLAKKLKVEKSSRFLRQVQKTNLYFSNPYWLHYQLSNEAWNKIVAGENDALGQKIKNAQLAPAPHPDEHKTGQSIELDEHRTQDHNTGDDMNRRETKADAESSGDKLQDETLEKTDQPQEEIASLVPEPGPDTEIFLDQLDTVVRETISNQGEPVLLEDHSAAEEETATQVMEEMAGVTQGADESTEAFLHQTETSTEVISQPSLPETATPDTPADNLQDDKNDEKPEPDEHEKMFQNIKAMLDATSEEADADVEDAVIPIDPYYTIDYFASQGIKLDLEPNPKDQLGQNLKKFTQWLKHMKKLGPEDATEVITRTDTEANIQQIAESSNTVREVVTEAMAAVLEKQGKNDKAIELYKKLSFLNPDKSVYFAAKIKNLKGI